MRVAAVVAAAASLGMSADRAAFIQSYKGAPYYDNRLQGPQKIPGKVMCAYYDRGGEGVAYHDTDAINHGSGELNPADGSYLERVPHQRGRGHFVHQVRSRSADRRQPFGSVTPPPNLLYVGWTEPGEWFNMTVDVAKTADYTVDLLYTSNRGGAIRLDVNGEQATDAIAIDSTFNPAETMAWRQWHHWNTERIANPSPGRGPERDHTARPGPGQHELRLTGFSQNQKIAARLSCPS